MGVTMKSGYMLLFRGTAWDKDLSPDQIQDVMTRWMAWFDGLMEDGRAESGQPLEPAGKIVSGKNGAVADGPFAESKEAIGGYFMLTVETEEEAIEIARMCPGLEHGMQVEVRPVRETCPTMDKAAALMAQARN
jgi:hypothetical protein